MDISYLTDSHLCDSETDVIWTTTGAVSRVHTLDPFTTFYVSRPNRNIRSNVMAWSDSILKLWKAVVIRLTRMSHSRSELGR